MNELITLVDYSRSMIYQSLLKLIKDGYVGRSKVTRRDELLRRRFHFFRYFVTEEATAIVNELTHVKDGVKWFFAF